MVILLMICSSTYLRAQVGYLACVLAAPRTNQVHNTVPRPGRPEQDGDPRAVVEDGAGGGEAEPVCGTGLFDHGSQPGYIGGLCLSPYGNNKELKWEKGWFGHQIQGFIGNVGEERDTQPRRNPEWGRDGQEALPSYSPSAF
jgi:hypothetical protein